MRVGATLLRGRDVGFVAALHVVPAIAIVRGTRARDWAAFAAFYLVGCLGTGMGLHRYFAHRAFRTSRSFQLALAVIACTSFADPIGFASKHRVHHRHADTHADVHTPRQGFWFCWFGSMFEQPERAAQIGAMVPDLMRYPELVWLHRWYYVPGVALAAATWALGGFSVFAIGFILSRALMLNLVSSVNFFCHLTGRRRYATSDASTNNTLIALLTFGEGWHNNHHHFPRAARAGFQWWELDPIYYVIRVLALAGVVWKVRDVPRRLRDGDALTVRRLGSAGMAAATPPCRPASS
jgi:stearoyl-CoA desaturase (Delta-9 desaturase)